MPPPAPHRHGDDWTPERPGASPRTLTRRCGPCGATFTMPYTGGRPAVVCTSWRAAHAADLAAQRMRRYRQRQQERAEYVAYGRERPAAGPARRLLAEYPAAAEGLLTRVAPEVAALVIDALLRLDAEADEAAYQAAAQRQEG